MRSETEAEFRLFVQAGMEGVRAAYEEARPTVQLTAFDEDGRVVWRGIDKGGTFGWVSPTHPNH